MRRGFFSVVALGLVAGCGGGLYFDKPGMAPGSGQDDLTRCEIEAAQQVPTSTRVNTNFDGRIASHDANAALRWRAVILCMEEQGYSLRGKSYTS